MPHFKFTARSIPPLPASDQADYWDESLPGFGMRVSAGGTRAWVVMYRYNGVKRRMKLGNHPDLGLADARDKAREALRRADKGGDPATEKRQLTERAETVKDLADSYMKLWAKPRKRSWKKDQEMLDLDVLPAIGRKRIRDVTRADVRNILDTIMKRDAPTKANHVLGVIRKMFNWAIHVRDMPILNPAAGIPKPGETNSRARYLSGDELVCFWDALDEKLIGTHGIFYFYLLLFTAQREMEVLSMRWSDIDLENAYWTVPGEVSKNEEANLIPLSPFVVGSLMELRKFANEDDEYVFQSDITDSHVTRVFVQKRMEKILDKINVPHFVPHDLRRTVTTYLGMLKVPQIIKKKILNHTKKKKFGDVTEIYDRFEYIDEKRAALIAWEKLLLGVVGVKNFDTDAFAETMKGTLVLGRLVIREDKAAA